jgi:hypothetical protein
MLHSGGQSSALLVIVRLGSKCLRRKEQTLEIFYLSVIDEEKIIIKKFL